MQTPSLVRTADIVFANGETRTVRFSDLSMMAGMPLLFILVDGGELLVNPAAISTIDMSSATKALVA